MPRRRPVNGPTVTQLLTMVPRFLGPPVQISPPTVPNVFYRPIGFLSGTSLAALSGVGPALPVTFLTRTVPASTGILNANAASNVGSAQDAASRGWQQVKARIFG